MKYIKLFYNWICDIMNNDINYQAVFDILDTETSYVNIIDTTTDTENYSYIYQCIDDIV